MIKIELEMIDGIRHVLSASDEKTALEFLGVVNLDDVEFEGVYFPRERIHSVKFHTDKHTYFKIFNPKVVKA